MANWKTNKFAKAWKAKNGKLHDPNPASMKVVTKSRQMMEKALGKKSCPDCGKLSYNCQ